MAIRIMDKITFDGDQIKFPASAILQEDLEGDITELKSGLSDTQSKVFVNHSFDPTVVKGKYIGSSDGINASSSKTARTNLKQVETRIAINLSSSTYIYRLHFYDSTGNVNNGSGYLGHSGDQITGIQFVPKEVNGSPVVLIGLSIRRTDNATITDDDVTAISSALSSLVVTDNSFTMLGTPADSFAVGARFSEVDAAIEKVSNNLGFEKRLFVGTWQNGSISTSTGAISGGTSNRCYSGKLNFNDYQLADNMLSGNVVSGYAVSAFAYKASDNSFIGQALTFTEGEFTLKNTEEAYYRFVLRKTDDSDFSRSTLNKYFVVVTAHTYDQNANIVSRNDPVNTDMKFQQMKRATRTGPSTHGLEPLCLIHFSDIHGDRDCLQNVVDFKNRYSDYIDDVIHTGDSVYQTSEDGFDFWTAVDGSEHILNVIGNHDTKTESNGNNWTAIDMATAFQTYFSTISNWDVTYQSNTTYYYKDYAEQKVRLIVLDIMHQTAAQLSWFESTLSSAITDEYHVVVAVHSRPHWEITPFNSKWDDFINSPAYQSGYTDTSENSGSSYPSNLASGYTDAVDDFIEGGGTFICWLHGHTHYRVAGKLTSHPSQLVIAVANSGGADYAATYVWDRVARTKTMDDFNVISFDTTAKILRIFKVGVNCDRYMRVVDTLCIDYNARSIIIDG